MSLVENEGLLNIFFDKFQPRQLIPQCHCLHRGERGVENTDRQ